MGVAGVLLGAVRAASAPDAAIPGKVERTTLSDAARDYELRSLVLPSAEAPAELILASRARDRRSEPETLLRAVVAPTGKWTLDSAPPGVSEPPLAGKPGSANPGAGSAFVAVGEVPI